MTAPGLTTAGFVAAQTSDVQTSIQNDQLATIDPALNLSPTQPLGQMNGILASDIAGLSALQQGIYGAFDPNNAQGVQLDNLFALRGVTRLPATKTLVLCSVNLNASQSYVPGQLTANITGYPQYTFVNRDTIASTAAGSYSAYFVATTTGPIVANAGTLSTITTTIAGWNSITNATSGTTGTVVESDTQYRIRANTLIVPAGGSTLDSMRSSLLLVPGVITALVPENNTLNTDANLQAPKTFQPLIWDGPAMSASNNAIAQAVWNAKPGGIPSFGTSSGTAIDSTGVSRTVLFTRVTQVVLYASYVLATNSAYQVGTSEALVQAAAAAVGAGLVPGSAVYALAFRAAALAVPGVTDVTSFAIDTSYPPPGTSPCRRSRSQRSRRRMSR